MTPSLALYRIGARLLEAAAPVVLRERVKRGKERADRLDERMGRASAPRPDGPLIWLHGASVGECRLLADLFRKLRQRRPDVSAVITSQTLTAADMIAARGDAGLLHQMAPVDGPGPVQRFLDHWRPDVAVFAEGEIWPSMLLALQNRKIPGVLANARMTERSLRAWESRKTAAQQIFQAFTFIGAADLPTAANLERILGRRIETVGNLKLLGDVPAPDPAVVAPWRAALD